MSSVGRDERSHPDRPEVWARPDAREQGHRFPGSPPLPSQPPPAGRLYQAGQSAPSRGRRVKRQRSRLQVAAIVLLVLLVLAAGGLWILKKDMLNFHRTSYGDVGNRPDSTNNALNILLIGSDNREGSNAKYGKDIPGQRGDVTILLHINGNRNSATLVGIPRDSYVLIPECTNSNNVKVPAENNLFNSAFARGGISCTVKTFESLTRIRVNHFVIVDFTGFKRMVDALGTVNICLPQAVNDPDSGLTMSAGRHEVGGEQALAYVRVRENIGDGSDLGRMKRQQAFLAAVAQKATSTGVLTNPLKLRNFIKAASSAATVDEDFSDTEMLSLGHSLRGIGLNAINFATLPVLASPVNDNWVEWGPSAYALWDQLRNDTYQPSQASVATAQSVPHTGNRPSVKLPQQFTQPEWSSLNGQPVVAIAPQSIHLSVANGTGQAGLAATVAGQLGGLGFKVDSIANAEGSYPVTVVRHGEQSSQIAAASTVLASIPGAAHQTVTGMGDQIQVILGTNFTKTQAVIVQGSTANVKVRKAADDVCS